MSNRTLHLPFSGNPGRLIRQLAALVDDRRGAVPIYPMLVVESVATRPWSSATFEGERHRFDLRLHGDAEAIGDALVRLVESLPDAEFDLPGQIVAEAKLMAVRVDPDPSVLAAALVVEFLTVID